MAMLHSLAKADPTSPLAEASPPAKRRKLTGRAFYENLGSPKVVLAPMVDQSEFAWRMLTRSYMKPQESKQLIAYTPMFHSRLFVETQKFRDRHFQPTRHGLATPKATTEASESSSYLDGNPQTDRPLFVQFCANDPDALLDAARYVQPYCDAVDLNLGCPQGIAKRGNYGAFLQDDQALIYKLINKLHGHLEVPVTAKMRVLETKEKTLEYAQLLLSAGASILTVHGRQRHQKGHQTGLADWSVLRYLREQLPTDTVIFANGNILRHEDIQNCLDTTGADAVMSAEGNLHDPTIFAHQPCKGEEGREYWRGRNSQGGYRMDAVLRRYLDIIYEHVLETSPPSRKPLFLPSDPRHEYSAPDTSTNTTDDQPPKKKRKRNTDNEKPNSPSLLAMQPHLFRLLRPLVTKHTHIRDALAKSRAGDVPAFEYVLRLTEAAVREGLLDYEVHPESYDEPEPLDGKAQKGAEISDESSLAAVEECKRPWWVCQPYVRPLPKEALAKGSLTMSKQEKKRLEEEKVLAKAEEVYGTSRREILDKSDGVPKKKLPKQAMEAG